MASLARTVSLSMPAYILSDPIAPVKDSGLFEGNGLTLIVTGLDSR